MAELRLPSFNDFSPEILGHDLRRCLQVIIDKGGDDQAIFSAWQNEFFEGKANKRSTTNIPATLRSTGLSTGERPIALSEFGERVLAAKSAVEASQLFCAKLIQLNNGEKLLEAIRSLRAREQAVTKKNLQDELGRLGISGLSSNTTDHSTFKNWLVHAEILSANLEPDDALLKRLTGMSGAEADEWAQLPLAQQIYLQRLRREHIVSDGPFLAKNIFQSCLASYPDIFDSANLAKQVHSPLQSEGWITVTGLGGGAQGGKSGYVVGTEKLLKIPIGKVVPDFDAVVPAELKKLINTPLSEIRSNLAGRDKHKAGLALELLALRLILDLGLDPRSFRLRSAQSAFAEVDLVAEGSHLLFSRWTFQCKRYAGNSTANVGLSEVAKEVGIALFLKAHVVVLVTTSRFTAEAKRYAKAISDSTPLQFLFIDGNLVEKYLEHGSAEILKAARANASMVMRQKKQQVSLVSSGPDE